MQDMLTQLGLNKLAIMVHATFQMYFTEQIMYSLIQHSLKLVPGCQSYNTLSLLQLKETMIIWLSFWIQLIRMFLYSKPNLVSVAYQWKN